MALYDASYRPPSQPVDSTNPSARFLDRPLHSAPYHDTPAYGSDDESEDTSDLEALPEGLMQNHYSGWAPFQVIPGQSLARQLFRDAILGTGRVVQEGSRLFHQQRQCAQMGEGPTLLRMLCFIGGLVMTISSVLSLFNIFSILTSPSAYILQVYQGFFGIITMIVEAKDFDCLEQLKPWLTQWFRFLTVPAGRGAFYLFVGSLGVSLWVRNVLSFTVGLYMSLMGVICVAIHTGTKRADGYGGEFEGDMVQHALNSAFEGGGVYDRPGNPTPGVPVCPPSGQLGGRQAEGHDISTTSSNGYMGGAGGDDGVKPVSAYGQFY